MIRFVCQCGRQLQAREDDVGRQAKCPACARVMLVPKESAAKRKRPIEEDEEDSGDFEPIGPPPRNRVAGWALGCGLAAIGLPVVSPFLAEWFQSPLALWLVPLILWLVPALTGLTLGIVALVRGGRRGTAIGGLATSCVGLLIVGPLALLVSQMRPAAASVRTNTALQQDQANLRRIAGAFLAYSDKTGRLPAATVYRAADGRPGLSWRVALLPHLGHEALFKRFKLDEAWDGPTNKPLLAEIPPVYLMPDQAADGSGATYYQVFVGRGTLFEEPKSQGPAGEAQPGLRWLDATDGAANTLLLTASRSAVPWTKPDDLAFNLMGILPPLSDRIPGGFNAAFGDGSVRVILATVPEAALRGMITRNGNEFVTPQ